MKYRRKVTEVECEQYLGPESLPIRGVFPGYPDSADYVVTIHGQPTPVAPGDWIMPEPDGEHFYPCKPEIFEATYEPVEE